MTGRLIRVQIVGGTSPESPVYAEGFADIATPRDWEAALVQAVERMLKDSFEDVLQRAQEELRTIVGHD